jgi:hypothetical protein
MIDKKLPITMIIQLLQSHNFYSVSENVEIAKGRDEYITTWKQVQKTFKRRLLKWQNR